MNLKKRALWTCVWSLCGGVLMAPMAMRAETERPFQPIGGYALNALYDHPGTPVEASTPSSDRTSMPSSAYSRDGVLSPVTPISPLSPDENQAFSGFRERTSAPIVVVPQVVTVRKGRFEMDTFGPSTPPAGSVLATAVVPMPVHVSPPLTTEPGVMEKKGRFEVRTIALEKSLMRPSSVSPSPAAAQASPSGATIYKGRFEMIETPLMERVSPPVQASVSPPTASTTIKKGRFEMNTFGPSTPPAGSVLATAVVPVPVRVSPPPVANATVRKGRFEVRDSAAKNPVPRLDLSMIRPRDAMAELQSKIIAQHNVLVDAMRGLNPTSEAWQVFAAERDRLRRVIEREGFAVHHCGEADTRPECEGREGIIV